MICLYKNIKNISNVFLIKKIFFYKNILYCNIKNTPKSKTHINHMSNGVIYGVNHDKYLLVFKKERKKAIKQCLFIDTLFKK